MAPSPHSLDDLRRVIERHWGYREFRPLQQQAMEASLAGRDSLVIMPTGGGKSLCYQAPAVVKGGTTVVVSPLISLMKDQVDSLLACGVAAAQLDSSLSGVERSSCETDLQQGAIRLLFISPERLAVDSFVNLLRRVDVHTFAIDEAHCISHWGHDFRPEYRQLGRIKEWFPKASIHGYTATATEQVRHDIAKQLHLTKPLLLVGNFDRPNLTYRVLPREDEFAQILDILGRHKGEAGIIYCIRKADVDDLAMQLKNHGFKCLPYHAGLDRESRRKTQEAFTNEKCDIIVATVAFGMGINRSNLRYIIHSAMPKSIEHYQQETGRAGRDGLEAECVLLHGAGDFMLWKRIMGKASENGPVDPEFFANAVKHLEDLDRYSRGAVCRHRALVEYFGQKYEAPQCLACDICLGDTELVPDSAVLAQKILSCVARVQERFGINHVIGVLRGENTDKIRTQNHDKLTTYGLLREHAKTEVRDWIYQLMGQGVLVQDGIEYPILKLNPASWEVMKKQRPVKLIRPVRKPAEEKARKSKADTESWEGVDRQLFEDLRDLRRELALVKGMPPYIIFGDATLRELARVRPSTLENMGLIYGIGQNKLEQYGQAFLQVIVNYCQGNQVAMDVGGGKKRLDNRTGQPIPRQAPGKAVSTAKSVAWELFRQNYVPEDVAHQINRSLNSVYDYLAEFIRNECPNDISLWVKPDVYKEVANAAALVGTERLKPIFEALESKIPYEMIRVVVAHLETKGT